MPAPTELHAHSCYSFLDGASQPDELALRAAELGYESFALTDNSQFGHHLQSFFLGFRNGVLAEPPLATSLNDRRPLG